MKLLPFRFLFLKEFLEESKKSSSLHLFYYDHLMTYRVHETWNPVKAESSSLEKSHQNKNSQLIFFSEADWTNHGHF